MKTIILLLAGLFAVLSSAATMPLATWTDFEGLTSDTTLAPQQSTEGSAWRFNLAGGTVTDGVLTTGTTSAPYISFSEDGTGTINCGTSSVKTVILKVSVPVTHVASKPLVLFAINANANNSIGLSTGATEGTVTGAWSNGVWSGNANTEVSLTALSSEEEKDVYLAVSSRYPLSFAEVSSDMDELVWSKIADGLRASNQAITRILLGNYYGATENGLSFTIKAASVLGGEPTLDDIKLAIRVMNNEIQDVSRTISGSDVVWATDTDSEWTPSKPDELSNVILTVDGETTLKMDTLAEVIAVTVNEGTTEGTKALTITTDDATTGKLTASSTAINADTTIAAGAADLGVVTIASGKTLTINDATAITSVSGGGSYLKVNGGTSETPLQLGDITSAIAGLTIESGVVKLAQNKSWHSWTTPVTVGAGATLDVNKTYDNEPSVVTLAEGATLMNTMELSGQNSKMWRNIALSGSSATISGTSFGSINNGYNAQSLYLNGGTLTIAMDDSKVFTLTNADIKKSTSDTTSESGIIKVKSGELYLHPKSSTDYGDGSKTTFEPAGGIIKLGSAYTMGAIQGESGTVNLQGNTLTVGALAKTTTYAGIIEGTGALTVTGGNLTLSGANTTTGALNVNVGEVAVTGAWTGSVAVATSATLAGSGTIGGDLTLADGAILNVGSTPLTVTGTVTPSGSVTLAGDNLVADTYIIKTTTATADAAAKFVIEGDFVVTYDDEGYKIKAVTVLTNQTLTATVGTAEGNQTSWTTLVNNSLANYTNATLTIHFSEAGQTFTFDNTADLTFTSVTVTAEEGVTDGTIAYTGTGALSIETFTPNASVTIAGTFLKEKIDDTNPIAIADGATLSIDVASNGTDWDCGLIHSFSGAGTLKKVGAGSLALADEFTDFTCTPAINVAEGAFRFSSSTTANYANDYTITVEDGAMLKLGYGCILTGTNTTITLNDGATIECKNGNNTEATTAAIVVNGNATIAGSWGGESTTFAGGISGNGTLTLDIVEASPMLFTGVIANGTDGTLAVKVNHTGGVTFSGANTYTGGTDIAAGAKLTITNADALSTGTITGAGNLICSGVIPTNKSGLNVAEWTGTVTLTANDNFTNLEMNTFGNAASTLELAGIGNGTNQTYVKGTATIASALKITGDNYFTDGSSSTVLTFTGALLGDGSLQFGNVGGNPSERWNFTGDVSGYEGAIVIGDAATKRKVLIGSGNGDEGKIVIAAPAVIPASKTWKAVNGISVVDSGTISGTGTLSIPSGKTLAYNAATESTFAGTISGEGSLTVSQGTLTLTKKNTYTGDTEIAAGAKVIATHLSRSNNSNYSSVGSNGNITGEGTLIFKDINASAGIPLHRVSSSTKVVLDSVSCYMGNNGETVCPIEIADGGFKIRNGWGNNTSVFSSALTGVGTITHQPTNSSGAALAYHLKFTDVDEFQGAFVVNSTAASIILGNGTAESGKLVIATDVAVPTDKEWTATNGVSVAAGVTLGGAGTIGSALTLAEGAILDVTGGLSVTSTLTLTNAFTVKVATLPDTEAVTLLTGLTAEPTLDGITVTVECNGATYATGFELAYADGTLTLAKDADAEITMSSLVATVTEGGTLSYTDALNGATLTDDASITINFGDVADGATATPGTFTFNNEAALTFASITITGTNGGTIVLPTAEDATVACAAMDIQTDVTAPVAFYNACTGIITAATSAVVATNDATEATFTATLNGGILTQAGEGELTFEGTFSSTTAPTTLGTTAGTLKLNESLTGWIATTNFKVAGGTLDLNDVYTWANDNSGYLSSASPLFTLGGTTASVVTGGNFTPYTNTSPNTQTIIVYDGGDGANAPATFEANFHSVYIDGARTRTVEVGKGAQTDGYDLEITGSLGIEGGQFASTTLEKTGEGILKLSGANSLPAMTISAGTVIAGSANALSDTMVVNGTLDLNGQTLTVTSLSGTGTIKDSGTTKGTLTVTGSMTFSGTLTNVALVAENATIDLTGVTAENSSLSVNLSNYTLPASFKVEGLTVNVTGEPVDYLKWDEENTALVPKDTLTDELIWLPIGDSITEGEGWMGHEGNGDVNSRGGYRYQLWKQLEAAGQQTRSVGFRSRHNATGGCGTDHSNDRWGWHAALYGGDITGGSSGAQLFNVESTLEVAGYPDIVTIMIGINDLSRLSTPDDAPKTYAAWSEMVKRYAILRPHTKIIVSTLFPCNNNSASINGSANFNSYLRADAEAKTGVFEYANVLFADVRKNGFGDVFDAGDIKGDKLHPNEVGSVKAAKGFQEVIHQAIAMIASESLAIVHVNNATVGQMAVRFNKALTSVDGLSLTVTGTDVAGNAVEETLTGGTLNETDKRVVTFTIPEDTTLINGTYTVSLTGTIDETALDAALTADGTVVEILGSGAAANVKASFLKNFKHRKTYTINDGAAPTTTDVNTEEMADVKRVGYYMELQREGQAPQFVWVSMNAFDETEAALGLPTAEVGAHKEIVSGLNVFANRGNFSKEITGGTGVIEFTPWSWTSANESLDNWPAEQGGYTGWDDTLETAAGTLNGCMQVARVRTESTGESKYDPKAEMLFAYNGFNTSTTDVGIGSFSTHRNNAGGTCTITYDWTNFSGTTGYTKFASSAYTVKKIELWVSDADNALTTATIEVGTADGQYTTWEAAKAGLNLADEMTELTLNFNATTAEDDTETLPTFTFDNTAALTVTTMSVTGTAGGSIAAGTDAAARTVATLNVNTSTTIMDGAIAATTSVVIDADQVLTYAPMTGGAADYEVTAAHSGSGTLNIFRNGVYKASKVTFKATNSCTMTVGEMGEAVIDVGSDVKAFADNVRIETNGYIYLKSGYAFATIVGQGSDYTQVTGEFTLGLGGDGSGSYTFTALDVAKDATLKLRSWRDQDITCAGLTVSGTVDICDLGTHATPITVTGFVRSYNIEAAIIDAELVLADGASVETEGITVTTVTLPASGTIKVSADALPTEEAPLTLFKTTCFADDTGYVPTTLLATVNDTAGYLLYKNKEALEVHVPETVTDVTATVSTADSWADVIAELTSKGQIPAATGATLTIDFGDAAEDGTATPGTFTFDNAADLTFASIVIKGTNGGTITKTGAGSVTTEKTTVNAAVTINGQLMFNGTTIAEEGSIATTSPALFADNTVDGAGTLTFSNISNWNGSTFGVAETWTGTVEMVNVIDGNINLAKMVTANSNLTLNNVTAYIYECEMKTLTLNGTYQMINGTSWVLRTQCVTVETLTGAGDWIGPQNMVSCTAFNVKNVKDFTGSIDLSHTKSAKTTFFFGETPERFTQAASNSNTANDAQEYFANDYGKIITTINLTVPANKQWIVYGVDVAANAALTVNGWLNPGTTLTLADGATVTVENGGVLDLRALDDLKGINVTVNAGGTVLVKNGASVPDTITFADATAILGVCTNDINDVGTATLTVTTDGTANSTATKQGYRVNGTTLTELGEWAEGEKTTNDDGTVTTGFTFTPVFDGELCLWAYEFDNDENTTTNSTDGPDNSGRDGVDLLFDGSGSEGRVCVGDEYVTNADDTKALRLAAAPYRDVSSYPEAFTATVYGKLTSEKNTILLAFGSTAQYKNTIALVTGTSANEVRLVWIKGHEGADGQYPANCVTILATTTVPNGTTDNHLFGFSYELKDADGDGTKDTTEVIFYVDGDKYQPFKINEVLTLGGGFQCGSIHYGWPREGKAPTESDWLERMLNNDADKAATIEYLRLYDEVLTSEVFTTMAKAYPYESEVGRATRTIVAGQDSTWNEATDWTQTTLVTDETTGEPVRDENGALKFTEAQVEKPTYGTLDKPELGTQVYLNVNGDNTLYLNEFYSSPIATNETTKLHYERLEINSVNNSTNDVFRLYAGRKNPALEEGAEEKRKSSAVITVLGYTKINTDVVMANNVAYLSGPVSVAEGKTLTFDFTEFDVMKVPVMPAEYRLTGFLDEATRERVTSRYPAEPKNGRSVDLGYKENIQQYTFRVDRYPLTAFFTTDETAGGVNDASTAIDFSDLKYAWQGAEAGQLLDWEATATIQKDDNTTETITENTLKKFAADGEFDVANDKITVTLASNDSEPATLTLAEAALSKTTTEASTDDEGNTTEAVVEDMLGEQQLIIGKNVIVDYTGSDAAELAPYINSTSATTTGTVTVEKATFGDGEDEMATWRANLTIKEGGTLAGVGTIEGKLVIAAEDVTFDASAATEDACLSAKDADLTNLKAITVDYESVKAAGTTGLRILALGEDNTAVSLTGCVVTANKDDNTSVEWTESGDEPTLVVRRTGGIYVVGRPEVVAPTTGEDGSTTSTAVDNDGLTLPLARYAAELGATKLLLTEVHNMAGEVVEGASVADAAALFTGIDFDRTGLNVEGVATAALKYDFGVSNVAVVGEYVILEVVVSNHADVDSDQNTANYTNGVTVTISCDDADVDGATEVADLAGTEGAQTGAKRYIKFPMPTDTGTHKYKARAKK